MTGKTTFLDRLKVGMQRVGIPFKATALMAHLKAHAKRTGVPYPIKSRQTVYSWMDGKNTSASHLLFLAEAIDVDVTWLGSDNSNLSSGFRRGAHAEGQRFAEPPTPQIFDDKGLLDELKKYWPSLTPVMKQALVDIAKDRALANVMDVAFSAMKAVKGKRQSA